MQYVSVRYKQSARLYEAGPTWETQVRVICTSHRNNGANKTGAHD